MLDRVLYVLIIYLALCVALTYAYSQEMFQHTHEGEVGKFYKTWMRPPERQNSCCDNRDCYSTKVKQVGGTWFFLHRETQEWKPIPADKIEENLADGRESPDGMAHVCASSTGFVFCAVIGQGQF